MTSVQEDEARILKIVKDYIASQSKRLGELGLSFEISIVRKSSSSEGYTSEICAEFCDADGPWDALEFEVVRKGDFVVSVEDIGKWLPRALGSLVMRREDETGDGRESQPSKSLN